MRNTFNIAFYCRRRIIRGIIGRVNVKDIGDTKVANLSVATVYVYKSHDGGVVIETT